MFFAIDIDQTISTGFVGSSLEESVSYYRERGLTIPDALPTYRHLFQLPQVMRIHETLPDAVSGVQKLAHYGDIYYYTVRLSLDTAMNQRIQQNTCEWLQERGFPQPEHTCFCKSIKQKLRDIASHILREDTTALFIDDRWSQLLNAFEQMTSPEDETLKNILCQRLTLVAFGCQRENLPAHTAIPVVALQSWAFIDDFVSAVVNKDVLPLHEKE